MCNTFITAFWRTKLLNQTGDRALRTDGYRVIHVNASEWREEADLHTA